MYQTDIQEDNRKKRMAPQSINSLELEARVPI